MKVSSNTQTIDQPGSDLNPANVPLSLYVHLPWCIRKCPYCDFNSHRAPDVLPEQAYVDALIADLDFSLTDCADRPLQSIFIGGGTPSLFSAAAIHRLLDAVRERVELSDDCEITLEANPGASEQARFAEFREAGVNRLSLGLQSLDDGQLRALGRVHDANAARAAVGAARNAGFDNFNTDMMYALPAQSPEAALTDLQSLVELGAPHISYYQLTLEPGTPFFHRPPPVPDNDTQWAIQSQAVALLEGAGFRQYEVSAWARPGHECRHNLNYWRFGDYLGIGAGAHGKITRADGRIVRTARQPMPRRFQMDAGTGGALASVRALSPADREFEFLLNALRLNEGFSPELYNRHTGLDVGQLLERLAVEEELVEVGADEIRCTEKGARYLDELLTRILPEDDT